MATSIKVVAVTRSEAGEYLPGGVGTQHAERADFLLDLGGGYTLALTPEQVAVLIPADPATTAYVEAVAEAGTA